MSALVWLGLFASVAVPRVTVEVDGFCLREEVAPPFERLDAASWILVRTSTRGLAVFVVTRAEQIERSVPLDGGCALAAERAAMIVERALEPMFTDGGALTLPAPAPAPTAVGYAFGASWLVDSGRLRTGPGLFVRGGVGPWYGELAAGVLLPRGQPVSRDGRVIGDIAAWSAFAELRGARCVAVAVAEACVRVGLGAERTSGRGSGALVFAERARAVWDPRVSAVLTAELAALRPVSAQVFAGGVLRPTAARFAVDDAAPDWEVPRIAAVFGVELGFVGAAEIF